MQIALCGHFEAFEIPQSPALQTVCDAKRESCTLGILIGDIGIADKLSAFLEGGKYAVLRLYERRLRCSRSECVRIQLTRSHLLQRRIDWTELARAAERFEATQVLPSLSQLYEEHRRYYGLSGKEILFSERRLRNSSRHRLSSDRMARPSSWWSMLSRLDPEQALRLVSEMQYAGGHRSCSTILLALFEQLANLGYSSITWFIEDRHLLAARTAERNLALLKTSGIENFLTKVGLRLVPQNSFGELVTEYEQGQNDDFVPASSTS